jgi:hypothetical protein
MFLNISNILWIFWEVSFFDIYTHLHHIYRYTCRHGKVVGDVSTSQKRRWTHRQLDYSCLGSANLTTTQVWAHFWSYEYVRFWIFDFVREDLPPRCVCLTFEHFQHSAWILYRGFSSNIGVLMYTPHGGVFNPSIALTRLLSFNYAPLCCVFVLPHLDHSVPLILLPCSLWQVLCCVVHSLSLPPPSPLYLPRATRASRRFCNLSSPIVLFCHGLHERGAVFLVVVVWLF